MTPRPSAVAILPYDGVRLLDVTGPIEVFEAFAELPRPIDTLIVPGAPDWQAIAADGQLVSTVADAARRSRRTASVCAGAFVLAAAGLLDARRATTQWEIAADLACTYPQITLDADAIFVAAGPIHTSAGSRFATARAEHEAYPRLGDAAGSRQKSWTVGRRVWSPPRHL